MDKDGLPQSARRGEQVVVSRIIQGGFAGPAIDHGADEAQCGGTFQFGDSCDWIRHRERGKCPKPCRVALYRGSCDVVCLPAQRDGIRVVE